MLNDSYAFTGFSVNNLKKAKEFYGELLGLHVHDDQMGLHIHLNDDTQIFIYEKEDHEPASFTILNFVVEDIDKKIEEMTKKGIKFERYDLGDEMKQDEKGVLRGLAANMGPDIAWFQDPAGNVLAILQDE